MRGMSVLIAVILAVLALSASSLSVVKKLPQKDLKGASDHPLTGRIEGSYIAGFDVKDFDTIKYPVKIDYSSGKIRKIKEFEGRVTRIYYAIPGRISMSAAHKAYKRSLSGKGFRVVYECSPCTRFGAITFSELFSRGVEPKWDAVPPDTISLLVMGGTYKKRDTVVVLYTFQSYGITHAMLRIVESEPLSLELKVIKAEEIKRRIRESGSVSIYGIYFDHDSAKIKPESRKAIAEIARFLKDNPSVKLYVVGHTDNTGSYEYNLKLSLKRAKAVVEKLVREYGIDRKRLKAVGVGPVAPVDSNKTEKGRSRNRRVELVEM